MKLTYELDSLVDWPLWLAILVSNIPVYRMSSNRIIQPKKGKWQ